MSEDKGILLGSNTGGATPLVVSVIAALTSTVLHTTSINPSGPPPRAIIRKLQWLNRAGVASSLRIGYLDLGGTFRQVFPDIVMVPGIPGFYAENELPLMGNTPKGFQADTTAATGTLGNIIVQATAAGAAPADVQVSAEVEEV